MRMRRSVLLLLVLLQLIALLGVVSAAGRRHLADLKDGVADGDDQGDVPATVSDDATGEDGDNVTENTDDQDAFVDEEEIPQPDEVTAANDDYEEEEENEAAFEELRAEQEAALAAIETALEDQLDLVAAQPAEPDEFYRVNSGGADVQQLVAQFMDEYTQEMSGMSLRASVIQVLQAQKTKPRPEVQDKELETNGKGGLDVDFVDEAVAQQFRILLLLNYTFQSSMLEEKRPYVSALRLTMDCSAASDCQVLEHVDLPRHNESTDSVSPELQRAIFSSAPAEFTDGQSKPTKVLYDAVETQYLDEDDRSPGADVMRYVRFRVAGGTAQDCMVVVQQTSNLNLLLYADNVCYKDAADSLAAAATSSSKENFPMFVLIASCAGAVVALVALRYRRKYQRSGYSYVHSKPGKMPSSVLSDDAAATA